NYPEQLLELVHNKKQVGALTRLHLLHYLDQPQATAPQGHLNKKLLVFAPPSFHPWCAQHPRHVTDRVTAGPEDSNVPSRSGLGEKPAIERRQQSGPNEG